MSVSKVTTKYQTSIPKNIRDKLGIKAGDYVEFDIANNNIIFRKINKIDKNFLKLSERSLEEWNSKEDDEQFDYLKNLVKK